jgi:hypothetical protein
MADVLHAERISPDGRPIRVRHSKKTMPTWLVRRRRAYRLIDQVAESAKLVVRHWLLPRPRNSARPSRQM